MSEPIKDPEVIITALFFEAGAILPVEMPRHGAAALLRGLLHEVPQPSSGPG